MSLVQRSFTALLWGTAGTFTKLFLQLGSQVVLARLLGPEQYGVFAIGVIVAGFANFLGDFGISYGLIQKETVSDDDVRYVLGWQILLGTIVAVLLIVGAEAIGAFFGEPSSVGVVRALAIVCLANSLCSISMNLLKRALNFKALNVAQVLGHFVGFIIVGIPLALLGFGVTSLVAAWIVQALVQLVLMYRAVRHPLMPTLKHAGGGSTGTSMLIYGRNVLAANLTNWGLANVDRIAIGRHFSILDVGLYSTAYNFLYNGTSALLGLIQSISFSASSRIQEDITARQRIFLGVSGGSLLLTGPLFVGLAAVSDNFILALYGDKWRNAADIFSPIALAMPLFVLWGLATPMLWTAGKTKLEGLLNLPLLCLWSLAVYLASSFSPQVVAWTVLLLYLLRAGLFVGVTVRALQLKVRSYVHASLPGGILSLIVAGPLVYVDMTLRDASISPFVSLSIDLLIALLLWGAGFRFLSRSFEPSVTQALSLLSSRLPPWLVFLLFRRSNS